MLALTLKSKLFFTLFMAIIFILIRWPGSKFITQRSWKVYVKNTSNFIIGTCLILIWITEVTDFGFSIIAIAAAIAISTKDFITCIVGGFYKTINNLFKIGDRIEIQENLGDVIDHNLISTKLLEVGPKNLSQKYTGRIISVPNGLFLFHSIYNLTSSKEYSFHVFRHPVILTKDIIINKKKMYFAALDVCRPYLEKARNEIQNTAIKEKLEPPKTEPVVSLFFKTATEVDFIIRVPVPVKMRGHYQQQIIHRYLERIL